MGPFPSPWRLAVALAGAFAALCAVLAPPAAASHDGDVTEACPSGRTPEDGFADLPEDNVHEDAVDCVTWWEVAIGRTRARYAPAAAVRRDQMASFVARMMEATGHRLPHDPPDRFRDDDGNVHERRINQLAAVGVVEGVGEGRYAPARTVRRGEMAAFLVSGIETVLGASLPRSRDHFPDDDGTTHERAVDKAAEAGIARGSGGRFQPHEEVRRDQMGSFLARSLDTLVERGRGAPPPANRVPPPEPFEDQQWGLERIAARDTWRMATGRGDSSSDSGSRQDSAVIAMVDSGVDREHPEFQGRLVKGASWVGCPAAPPCDRWDDRFGHGTHVAGIAAAPWDGRGVAGVAPEARIMPVRVLDEDGVGTGADVAAGIRYAVDNGAHVVNLSLGGLPVANQIASETGFDGGFAAAIRYAADRGVLVVAAAGNASAPVCGSEAFRAQRALCVGATDRRDVKSFYSNFGGGLDVVAPGGDGLTCAGDILSTFPIDASSNCGHPRGYAVEAGTSMAAPFVAGIGALLAENGITGERAARRIAATAVDLGASGYDPVFGHGLVHARRAVSS